MIPSVTQELGPFLTEKYGFLKIGIPGSTVFENTTEKRPKEEETYEPTWLVIQNK
jgi:hypothetical protein